MSASHTLEFIIPAGDAERISAHEEALHLRALGRHPLVLTYYDSFDWRLWRAGLEFAVENLDGQWAAVSMGTEGERGEPVEIAEPPRFAHQLPEVKGRGALAEALEVRALLPRAELRGERATWVLEDGEGTALADLVLEQLAVDRDGTPLVLPARLRLVPRKGFRKACRPAWEQLAGEFALEPAGASLLSAVLAALGRVPEDPSALLRTRLDPELRADAAVKTGFRNLLEILRINEAGVTAETDTEFLHDFRVAVRRTRSALGQIKKVFPERAVGRFVRGFAALGRATGEARDLDVYLLDFDRHAAELAEPLRGALGPLRELLRRRAGEAHARLDRYLESAAYRHLLRHWSIFLDTPPPRRPRAPKARLRVQAVADRRIWKLYRRVLEEGGAILPESPAEQLHELRKTAKKLRYLMEFFRSLYPPEKIGHSVKILKGLQDHLGEYQDVHVQIARLREFAEELRRAEAPTATLLALGALLDRLHGREKLLRDGFAERFEAFAEGNHQRKFKSLFKPAAAPGDDTDSFRP